MNEPAVIGPSLYPMVERTRAVVAALAEGEQAAEPAKSAAHYIVTTPPSTRQWRAPSRGKPSASGSRFVHRLRHEARAGKAATP